MAGPLAQLGQALSGGARDYANIKLSREAEARERQQRLDDVASQRQYADSVEARQRGYSLSDEARRRTNQREDVTIDMLVKERYLSPDKVNDPAAVQAAAAARQERVSADLGREGTLPKRLQTEADLLATRDAELAEAEQRLSASLSAPEPGPPTQTEVMNLAMRLTGKPNPSREEIAANEAAAAEQIQSQRLQRWYMDQQEAKTQIPLLRAQRSDISRNLTFMFQQGITPNRPPAAVLSAPVAPVPRGSGSPMGSFLEQLNQTAPPPAASAPSAASNYQYPAYSVAGLGERAFGGGDFTAERFAEAPANILAFPGRVIDQGGRLLEAGARGLAVGDWRMPEKGTFQMAGEKLGSLLAPGPSENDFMSARRREEEARRRLLQLSPTDASNPAVQFGPP